MKIYLNAEGAVLQVIPSVIGRGSTVADFTVEAPIPAVALSARFTLRSGTTEPLLLPRIGAVSYPGLNVWSAKLPYTVTEFAGTVPYIIEAIDGSGAIINSTQGTITISPGAAPVLPPTPPADAWAQMMTYLNAIYNAVNEGTTTDELAKSIKEIRRWIDKLEETKSITEDGVSYELIESRFADKLEELVTTKGIAVDGSTYMLLELTVAAISKLWADILANEGLLAGDSIKGDEIVGLSGKHLRFTSDEEMKPLNDMLADYEAGEIGGGGVESVNGKKGAVELNADDVGAEESGTVGRHNTSPSAHTDIRESMRGMLKDSDIVNSLTSDNTSKPLSAAMGKELKRLIDEKPSSGGEGADEVYILSEGESLDDVPDTVDVVIDPYAESVRAVRSINGILPDANGNINFPMAEGVGF